MFSLFSEKLQQYSTECRIKLENTSFLLSFSGGLDSTIMASLLVKMRNEYNIKIGFAHINHHAHEKSCKVEKFTLQYSNENNVKYFLHELFFDTKRNFESCSREKRYKILDDVANKHSYQFILTAHHQDDQLETVFMKKMDGGDWLSQIGIREKMGKLRRPFLDISKKEINTYAKQLHITWIEDPTNSDMTFRRNKVRQLQLPYALKVNPKLNESLLNTAHNNVHKLNKTVLKLKREQDNVIMNYSKNIIIMNRKALQRYKLEELKLFIYSSLSFLSINKLKQQSGGLWREFKDFIQQAKTGAIFQIDILTFIINRDKLIAINNLKKLINPPKLRLCNNLLWYSGQFKIRNNRKIKLSLSKNTFTLPASLYRNGLYIRPWVHGDRIISATSKKHVSLSDLYINNKLSKYAKLTHPVVIDDNDRIFWIPGLMHGNIDYKNIDNFKVINWIKK